jgi:hypothetical protein
MNTPTVTPTPQPNRPASDRKPAWWTFAGAAAVVAALVVGGAVMFAGDDDEPEFADPTVTSPVTDAPGKLKVLELSAPAEDLLASCIVISPESIAAAPVAFKGTVDTAENGIVTMTIDQAYKGTDAQVATLVAPDGQEALIGGITFTPGEQYLVTAYDGVVNYCGHSGPATPELQALFDQAFTA